MKEVVIEDIIKVRGNGIKYIVEWLFFLKRAGDEVN